MLHEGVALPRPAHTPGYTGIERRAFQRVPFPAELVVTWFHDMKTPIRYRVIDAGEGGFRIRTTLPLIQGMTGVALKLLPEGRTIERTVSVAWVRLVNGLESDAGLKLL